MTAYLDIKLTGKGVLTEVDNIVELDVLTKREQVYFLSSESTPEVIDWSDITNLRAIYIYSASPFVITLTKGAAEISLTITDHFVLTPGDIAELDSISIVGSTTTSIYINVRMYGE